MAVVASAAAGRLAAERATIVQLRAPGLNAHAFEEQARELVMSSPVPVLVSSRCDIALAVGAAGVHLPESDISVEDARALLGDRLIGRSAHSLDSALQAERQGADYVIFGPVWPSPSHPDSEPAGLRALAEVAKAVRVPVLAIGGVTAERISECHAAGAAGYAAIRLFQMVTLRVNGKRVDLDGPTPLLAYLETLGVNARAVAVELNGSILERIDYASAALHDGDTVEIVRMVGGGADACTPAGATFDQPGEPALSLIAASASVRSSHDSEPPAICIERS